MFLGAEQVPVGGWLSPLRMTEPEEGGNQKKALNRDVDLYSAVSVMQLTPKQEQFLSEFYALCGRYQQAGVVVAYSRGLDDRWPCYEVAALLPIKTVLNRRSSGR